MVLILSQRIVIFIYINARNVVDLENKENKEIISGPMSKVKIILRTL